MIDGLMLSIVDKIENENRVDIIEFDNDCVIVSELGFDNCLIDLIENECNVMLDYEYKSIDDIDVVEIEIRC